MWNYSAAEGNMQSRKSLLDLFGQNTNLKWFELDEANPTLALDWPCFSFPSPDSLLVWCLSLSMVLFSYLLEHLNVSSVWAVPLAPASLWNTNFCPHNMSVPNTAEIFNVFLRLKVRIADYFRDTTGICLLSSRNIVIMVLRVNLLFRYINLYISL